MLALGLDWAASMLVVAAVIGQRVWSGDGGAQWAPLAVFGLEAWLFTALIGGSAGQIIVGVGIRRTSGKPIDLLCALLRTALICLVIPAVIYDRDQRGLHDLAVDSIVVRR